MGVLDELATFVATASVGDLPREDRAILRRHVRDVVAARIAGAACSEGRIVAAFYAPGKGADSIAGLGALVRLTETDDIHTASGTTPSSVAVPVALALAAEQRCDPGRLESAIFVGTELVVRLGKAIGGAKVLYQGIWPTRAGAALGACAVACRIWGLSVAATRNALSMTLMFFTAGRTGRFAGEPSGRWIVFASAVAAGIRAAEASRAGFSGDPADLESGWLDKTLGVPVDLDALGAGLGRTSVYPELSLKPYCTSRQALPGAEAMRALVDEGLDPGAIEAFTIKVPSAYAGMISQQLDPAIRASAFVSGTGLAAIAALDPGSLYDVERAKAMADPRVLVLATKGTVVADPELDHAYPARWPARLEVRTLTATLHKDVLDPIGSPGHRLDDSDLDDKIRRELDLVGRGDAVAAVLRLAAGAFDSEAASAALARFFVDGRAG